MSPRAQLAVAAMASVVLGACGETHAGAPPPASPSATAEALSPVRAHFVELGEASLRTNGKCDVTFVAVARGEATVGPDALAEGDVAVIDGPTDLVVRGRGFALVASFSPAECPHPRPSATRRVRAGDAKPLIFADGKMRARLDVEGEPGVYFGRLDGTAPVAEHAHEDSWEILCDVEGAGTYTLAGEPHRLEPGQVAVIPPKTKHTWKPDPGVSLTAFQLYTPPGPEQRFKKMAGAK